MFPLRDTVPSYRFPIVTVALIVVNCLVFFLEVGMGVQLQNFIQVFGMTPGLVSGYVQLDGAPGYWHPVLTMVTCMFLHGGWMHLIGNMYFLWIFGDNVEDAMGKGKFIVFYLATGILGGVAHLVSDVHSVVPTVGASGAISGVLGAYLILFPRARVVTLVPLGFFIQVMELPAVIFLGVWFLTQSLSGVLALASSRGQVGGTAFWAHIGGFVAGVVMAKVFAHRRGFSAS